MTDREQRYKDFEDCQEIIKSLFDKWADLSITGKYLKNNFGFSYIKDSVMGGAYALFTIKWEDRTFDIDSNGNSMIEIGAKMDIRQSALGYVSIVLHPAHTSFYRQMEDYVIVRHKLKPTWLSKKWVVWLLWKCFLGYSAMTSIDTTPGLWLRLAVRLLKYTRPKCVNGIISESRILHDVKLMFALGFTLVTSSLFVFYLQAMDGLQDTAKEDLYFHRIDSIAIETTQTLKQHADVMSEKIDSIIASHKFLTKEIQEMNNKSKVSK